MSSLTQRIGVYTLVPRQVDNKRSKKTWKNVPQAPESESAPKIFITRFITATIYSISWEELLPAAIRLNLSVMVRSANSKVSLNRHRYDQENAEKYFW